MTTTPPAPAPDREAVRRAVEFARDKPDEFAGCYCEWCVRRREIVLALAEHWLARGPASDEAELREALRVARLHIECSLRPANDSAVKRRADLLMRIDAALGHAIAAPPADAGEKED